MHAHPTLETATMSLTVPAEAHSSRPTMIVLVHGAWADSQAGQVTRQLRHDGYRTVTPELGLNSVAKDVAIVRRRSTGSRVGRCWYPHSYGEGVTSRHRLRRRLPPWPPAAAACTSSVSLRSRPHRDPAAPRRQLDLANGTI